MVSRLISFLILIANIYRSKILIRHCLSHFSRESKNRMSYFGKVFFNECRTWKAFFSELMIFFENFMPQKWHILFLDPQLKFYIILPIYIFGGINAGYEKNLARSFTYKLPTNFHISNPNCHIKYFEKKLISHFNMDSQLILGQKLSHFVRERAKWVSRSSCKNLSQVRNSELK